MEFSETKSKNVIFTFLHFSNTYVFEKWRHIRVPQESLIKSEIPLAGLLFLCNHTAFGVYKYLVEITIRARHYVVVVSLPYGTDNLATGQTQQRNHARHVLEQRRVLCGKRRCSKQGRHPTGQRPCLYVFIHGLSPTSH
jgi:hypothetical protein